MFNHQIFNPMKKSFALGLPICIFLFMLLFSSPTEGSECYGPPETYCRDMGGLGKRCYFEGSPEDQCCSLIKDEKL